MTRRFLARAPAATLLMTLGAAAALAQQAPAPAAAPASAPAAQRVEVTGGRVGETEQRRQSTAAKIIVGRDEIERYGDSSTAELLKRLPGVTVGGRPGRGGGGVRMRGLGGGYTQILIDGERVPPGFSLDSIEPDQIERIEILRAPTAETGARAIAGTINIVMREGYRRRLNDVKLTLGAENGRVSEHLAWTRNESFGDWIANGSLSLFERRRRDDSSSATETEDRLLALPPRIRRETQTESDQRRGLHASARLQWRGDEGRALLLTPLAIHSEGSGTRAGMFDDSVSGAGRVDGESRGRFSLLRLNAQWNHVWDGTRIEWRAGGSESRWRSRSERREVDGSGMPVATSEDRSAVRDRNASAGVKASRLLDNQHSLVGGIELEANRRSETRDSLLNGAPVLLDFGDNLAASSRRVAAYAQDEWTISPRWAAHAGLRWEGIATQGDAGAGVTERNRSSVWTPLLHAVWKPDPGARDQLRMSLTRSYRSPPLGQLVARPALNNSFPAPGPNTPTRPDRAGNPALRPELATGIDLAFERYLPAGGILSANVFHREVSDLIRSLTALETVSWAGVPRWVARPQNIGDAVVQGIELEAKVRASDLWAQAPAIDLRANLSLFRSRVKSVPGPDNRLDSQPGATMNLGADWRIAGWPLAVGANLNLTPGYDSRLSETQTTFQGRKRVFDAYALWSVNPGLAVRLSASNLSAEDLLTQRTLDDGSLREQVRTVEPTAVNWQLRLEFKL
jgi:outer membrane receptor for ferrienterochelin and colicins